MLASFGLSRQIRLDGFQGKITAESFGFYLNFSLPDYDAV